MAAARLGAGRWESVGDVSEEKKLIAQWEQESFYKKFATSRSGSSPQSESFAFQNVFKQLYHRLKLYQVNNIPSV